LNNEENTLFHVYFNEFLYKKKKIQLKTLVLYYYHQSPTNSKTL